MTSARGVTQVTLYVVPGADALSGPLASGATPLQGKPLSYNNLLDAATDAASATDGGAVRPVAAASTVPAGPGQLEADG
ncbi:MAG: hypothetical protein LH650_03645 [Chloroflexi bacterium]|nr:hypothetical protein [Chloroflexota bacterium]